MSIVVRGHVQGGKLRLDEPIDLPDETKVEVAVLFDDEPDTFDAEERGRIDAAISSGKEAAARGEVFPIEQVLAELSS